MKLKEVITLGLGCVAALQLNAGAVTEGEHEKQVTCVTQTYMEEYFRILIMDCAGLGDNEEHDGIVDHVVIEDKSDENEYQTLRVLYNPEAGASFSSANYFKDPLMGYAPLKQYQLEYLQQIFNAALRLKQDEENLLEAPQHG